MARYLVRHNEAPTPIVRSGARDKRLIDRLVYELEAGYSSRFPLDSAWIEGRRQYAGVPETAVRNQPIPNAPNVELPIGALICDSLYAQASDTLYQAQPILTAREVDDPWMPHAQQVQRLINWMVNNEIGLRWATDNAFQDDIQLGTGVLYCPFVTEEKVTRTSKIIDEGPRLLPISPEDFLVPGGSRGDHQQDDWCDIRFWYTEGEFNANAKLNKWETDGVKPIHMPDRVRMAHEHVNRTSGTAGQISKYAVENVWLYHDYMDDGVDRDLSIAFDRNAKVLLGVEYNQFDTRPIETMRFQMRPHLFWGLGVLEMGQPLQKSATDTLNHFLLNMTLVNGRLYMARHGTVDDFKRIWSNRIVGVESTDDIKELRMADIYPSILMGLDRLIQLYERRVGVTGDFTSGNPASRILGTRTPGITAMSALQSVNRRFAPAFDGMRLNTAAAVRQCLWRYAERIRMGGPSGRRVEKHIKKLLGERNAELVFELFRQDDFEQCVSVEFTAVSASVNREADRQNAMIIMDKLSANNKEIVTLAAMMSGAQPGMPPPPEVIEVAKKAMKVQNEGLEMFLRSFDQIRNPKRYLIDIDQELTAAQENSAQAQAENDIMGQVMNAIGGGGAMNGGGAMEPEGEEPPPEMV